MSNDDENKRPSTVKNHSNNNNHNESSPQKEKKSSTTNQVQYRILQRGHPDEPASTIKKSQVQNELNTSENSTTVKSQRNRRKFMTKMSKLIMYMIYRSGRSPFE
jgi:hypothetical protein